MAMPAVIEPAASVKALNRRDGRLTLFGTYTAVGCSVANRMRTPHPGLRAYRCSVPECAAVRLEFSNHAPRTLFRSNQQIAHFRLFLARQTIKRIIVCPNRK